MMQISPLSDYATVGAASFGVSISVQCPREYASTISAQLPVNSKPLSDVDTEHRRVPLGELERDRAVRAAEVIRRDRSPIIRAKGTGAGALRIVAVPDDDPEAPIGIH